MNNKFFKNIINIINITNIGQIYNDFKHIYKTKNTNSKIQFKILVNLIFFLISILISISCNNNWKNRFFGIFITLISAPLYITYKLLNPSIQFNPTFCLNFNFQDRLISAFQ